jgi:tetratricopeptide (TPR) repeat protein
MDHGAAVALRLAVALAPWWELRGRMADKYPLLRQVARCAEPGSDGWCAAQFWLGRSAEFSGDLAGSLGHLTALRDAAAERGPRRVLVYGLAHRASALSTMGRYAEAAGDARRSLAMARELGYPAGEAVALANLAVAAHGAGDQDRAGRLARQAAQITVGVPGSDARWVSYILTGSLIEAGDLAAAGPVCAATLARARDAGDLSIQGGLLALMVTLELEAARLPDAAAHLRESLQLATRTGSWNGIGNALDGCGLLCAATGRPAEAVTVWAVHAAFLRHQEIPDWPLDARRRQDPAAPGPAGARTRPDPGGRRTRRGDEPGHRRRVRPAAHRPRSAAGGGPGAAQRPGAGAGHPGRPGPHRRPDRRAAVHQHPHRPFPPGPDPGQDRLPPPRRPDPPGPDRRTDLTPARPPAPRPRGCG